MTGRGYFEFPEPHFMFPNQGGEYILPDFKSFLTNHVPHGLLFALLGIVLLIGLIFYCLSSVGIYTMCKRRGIAAPYLAWIPVAREYALGRVADDISAFLGRRTYYAVILLVFAVAVIPGFGAGMILFPLFSFSMPIMLARKVFFYMAHSEIYRDYSPRSWVLFLVLTVMFPILSPVLLFVLRDNVPESAPRASAAPPNMSVSAPPRAGTAYSSAQEYSVAAGYSRYPQQPAPDAARQAPSEAPAEMLSEAHPEAPPEASAELPPEASPEEAPAELPPATEEPAGAPQLPGEEDEPKSSAE